MTAEVLDLAPKLKMLCHAAGSVKPYVSAELWRRGIRVTSAAAAMATGVAETTLGCMIIGVKKIFPMRERVRKGGWRERNRVGSREMYRKTIGIIGASHVGRKVIRLLDAFEVNILLFDPYVSASKARQLGATKVSLAELVRTSDVVSLHAPSTEETRHMLGAREFRMMKDGAIFINTARGAIVDETALTSELRKHRFFAFIDVTDPEPPRKNHPFFKFDNVVLTPHIAGMVDDFTPLAKLEIEEIRRFAERKKLLYPVTPDMLAHIA
jgi:phosphoglycerate dehydrogenase-like enzyme